MRAAFLALAFLAACATQAPAQPDLAGTEWLRADDADAAPHVATIAFTERGASGHTGCNRWFTSVTRNGDALRFGNIGTTRMACLAESAAATERNFLAALEATRTARVENGELVFLDAADGVVARFTSAR